MGVPPRAGRARTWGLGLGLASAALALLWLLAREPRNGEERAPAPRAPAAAQPGSPPAAPARLPETGESARLPSEVVLEGPRELVLVLERFPDHAPIARALVEVEPRAAEDAGSWLATDGEGRVGVRVPAAARTLRVLAAGFEPGQGALSAETGEVRLTLTPSGMLFGRVLRPDRSPAAEAEVELVASRWSVHLLLDERYPKPQSNMQSSAGIVARARTSPDGWYVLAPPHGTTAAEVQARLAELEGRLSVTLPRAPEVLPELVLGSPPRSLLVRVVSPDGRPIPGALVRSRENPLASGRDRTDERGELVISAPKLPATFSAFALGFLESEWRHDGRVVPGSTPVEEPTARLEIVLAPAGGARVRIVDAETRFPLYLVHGSCELVAGGSVVGRSDFEPDRDGLAWVLFVDTYRPSDPPVPPETARLTVSKEGYEEQVFELDARTPPGPEPIELALRPLAGWDVLRGRVVRAGEPLARFQVGMKAQPRAADPSRAGWQYGRAYTDAQGRFALRWRRDAIEQLVTVYPHWTSWDEFAFLGPLSEDEARTGEHVLELRPAVHVPALVRGVVRGGSYRYYVSLLEGEGAEALVVPTTINGVPLAADADGELRTLLRLPAHRRVQVTIGYVGENVIHADGCAPVVHDPTAPELPLVFELEALFLRVRGLVSGFTPAELANLALTLVPAAEPEARRGTSLTRPRPDGSFELQAPRGQHEIFLIDAAPGEWRTILARQTLVLERDLEGLVIVPDAPELPR